MSQQSSHSTKTGNRFGEIAVREGFASRKVVRECLDIQSKLRDFGVEPKRIGEIMLEKGYLREADVQTILSIQAAGASRLESRSSISEFGRSRPLRSSQVVPAKLSEETSAYQIPGYELLELLGKGGMGLVFKARQESLDRMVALKILPPAIAEEEDYIARFVSEARTVARLNHENIIAGIDVGEANGVYYFAMEHVEGDSASDLIEREGSLDERFCMQVGLQISKALVHAHKHGLVHRDIKPQNVLVTTNNQAKLCDLGLAKFQTDLNANEQGVPVGTPHYLSPEQARGDADVDIRSDIYSLGATLYHMLTGQTPFEGKSSMVLMTKHLTEQPLPPRHRLGKVSKRVSDLVMRMMQKDKEKRHQTPTQLAEDFDRVLSGKRANSAPRRPAAAPTSARSSSPDARRSRRTRKPGGGRTMPRRAAAGSDNTTLILIPLVVLILAGVVVYSLVTGPNVEIKPPPSQQTQDAAWQALKEAQELYRENPKAGQAALKRIIKEYPNTSAARHAKDYLRERTS